MCVHALEYVRVWCIRSRQNCVCVSMHMCVYPHVCAYVFASAYVHVWLCVCAHVCVCVTQREKVYACVLKRVCAIYMCVLEYVCKSVVRVLKRELHM